MQQCKAFFLGVIIAPIVILWWLAISNSPDDSKLMRESEKKFIHRALQKQNITKKKVRTSFFLLLSLRQKIIFTAGRFQRRPLEENAQLHGRMDRYTQQLYTERNEYNVNFVHTNLFQ